MHEKSPSLQIINRQFRVRERSGSVVECLTRDRGALPRGAMGLSAV